MTASARVVLTISSARQAKTPEVQNNKQRNFRSVPAPAIVLLGILNDAWLFMERHLLEKAHHPGRKDRSMTQFDTTDDMELFIQGEGIPKITLVKVHLKDTVADIIKVARDHGLSTPEGSKVFVFVENADSPLDLNMKIDEAGLTPRSRVHIHHCQRVEVTVNFNARQLKGFFPPSATTDIVQKWSVGKDGVQMSPVDATEHLLQVCHSSDRPDEDVHIGALEKTSDCAICFDLVPKQRVEG